MAYAIDELRVRNGSPQEQERTRKIFEDLKQKAVSGEELTEHEKEFFCLGVKLSLIPEDGKVEDYACCENYTFKFLYLIYFHDLTGGSKYQKPVKGVRQEVPQQEVQADLKYLIAKADEWDAVIQIGNHNEELLKVASKEARDDLKKLDQQPEFKNDPYAKGKFRYRYSRWSHLLQSRNTYHMAQEIYETMNNQPIELILGNETIEVNEYSLIHILSRHYAQITKKYNTGKSFHTEDFKHRLLGVKLKELCDEINNFPLVANLDVHRIIFQYKGRTYELYSNMRQKQVRGVGNVSYRRLESFSPLEEEAKLKDLEDNFTEHQLNPELSIYIKN